MFTATLEARVVVEVEDVDDTPTLLLLLLVKLPMDASDTKHRTVHISINLAGNVVRHSSSPEIPDDVEDGVRGEL